MTTVHTLESIARLPMAGDNTAIAIRRLEAGELVQLDGRAVPLSHTVLEGHRFAVQQAPVIIRRCLKRMGEGMPKIQNCALALLFFIGLHHFGLGLGAHLNRMRHRDLVQIA